MKTTTKSTTKVVVAILAAMVMFFSSMGQVVLAIYFDEQQPLAACEMGTQQAIEEISNLQRVIIEENNKNKKEAQTTVVTTVATTTTTTTTTVTTEQKEYFIFKPDTHYVHTVDCHWTKCGDTEKIENTEGIEVRLCDECNPNIEVMNEYVEPEPEPESIIYNYTYSGGEILTPSSGVAYGPSGFETYYNLDMTGVINIMSSYGYSQSDYWVRDDGCKMLGNYIMVAASLDIRPRGTILECSLGPAIVCDTGHFAYNNPYQLDIAVNW